MDDKQFWSLYSTSQPRHSRYLLPADSVVSGVERPLNSTCLLLSTAVHGRVRVDLREILGSMSLARGEPISEPRKHIERIFTQRLPLEVLETGIFKEIEVM